MHHASFFCRCSRVEMQTGRLQGVDVSKLSQKNELGGGNKFTLKAPVLS